MGTEEIHTRVAPYKVSDAASLTGLSTATLYRYAGSGQLKVIRAGSRTLLIPADEVRRLLGITGADK